VAFTPITTPENTLISSIPLLLTCVGAGQSPIDDHAACPTECTTAGASYAGVPLERVCLNIPYGTHRCQRLDAYIALSDSPTPVVVEVHGGALLAGSKSTFGPHVTELLSHGVSVVSINYRLTTKTNACCQPIKDSLGNYTPDPEYYWPAPNEDTARAIQFVRHMGATGQWNIDPNRVAGTGNSAGGMLTTFMAMAADGADPAQPGQAEGQSTRLACVLDINGPLNFTDEWFYVCNPPPKGIWYFEAFDKETFDNDTAVLQRRIASSPALLALATSGASAGWRANSQAPYLAVRGGDPNWTLDDFYDSRHDCTLSQGEQDPLWKPTQNPHSILFGLHMQDVLVTIGSTQADILVEPSNPCDRLDALFVNQAADFLCEHLLVTPDEDLSHIYEGKMGSNGLIPRFSAYGHLDAGSQATFWLRDGPVETRARLAISPDMVPHSFGGGTLVPGGPQLAFIDLHDTDACGHLSLDLPGTFASGEVYMQLVLSDPLASEGTGLSNPLRVLFQP
jgi:hypothetical protein